MTGRSFYFWTALTLCWLAAMPLYAQVVRLPAVMPPSEPYPAARPSVGSYWEPERSAAGEYAESAAAYNTAMLSPPDSPPELPPTEFPLPAPDPDRPADARDGVFQKLLFTHDWLVGSGEDEMGVHDLELKTVLALPIPSRNWPLLITPGFAVNFFNGPTAPDMPPRIYEAYGQFRSLGRINPRLGAELAVTLGAFGDFESTSGDPFRVTGHAAAMWDWTPTAKIVLGVAYINTYDSDVIPIGGLIWNPNEDFTVEAVFPTPKIAHRVYWRGACTERVQDWLYVAGEWGNDTWTITRAAGFADTVNYRDLRLLLGLERKVLHGLSRRIEAGYVFGRRLHYGAGPDSFDLSSTFLLRTGMTY